MHIIDRCHASHINWCQNTLTFEKEVGSALLVGPLPFVTVRILHLTDRRTAESSIKVATRINVCSSRENTIALVHWGLFASHIKPAATLLGVSSSVYNYSTSSATHGNASRIPKFCVSVDQEAPIPPSHTATFRRIDFISRYSLNSWSDIPAHYRKTAAIESWDTIEELDVRKAPFFWFGRNLAALHSHHHYFTPAGAPDYC